MACREGLENNNKQQRRPTVRRKTLQLADKKSNYFVFQAEENLSVKLNIMSVNLNENVRKADELKTFKSNQGAALRTYIQDFSNFIKWL